MNRYQQCEQLRDEEVRDNLCEIGMLLIGCIGRVSKVEWLDIAIAGTPISASSRAV